MSLTYISQQITAYTGFFLIATGLFGNGINILVFTSVRSYRKTSCTFYFLAASIFNILFISINLTSRIAISGYGFDLTRTSIPWCKMRLFLGFSNTLISLSFACLATIDQYFATSKNAFVRSFSNIKWARPIVFIVIIFWYSHEIPLIVFFNILPSTNSCANTNYIYATYHAIFVIGFLCIVPSLLMIIFGYLAYHNIHLTRALADQRADRQLIRMVLVEVILVLFSYVPFGINNTYVLATQNIVKDASRVMNENFATTLFNVTYAVYFAVSSSIFYTIIH